MSEPSATSTQYLSFIVAGEEYALAILQVKEIIEYDAVTRIPGALSWVRGVFNLRGNVVPVLDLAVKLGLPPCTPTRRSCTVVVEVKHGGEHLVLGLLADSIGQVFELGPGEVVPPPAFGTPVRVDCLLGLGQVGAGRKFILLLDIDRVLSLPEVLSATAQPGVEAGTPGEAAVATGGSAGAAGASV